MRSLERLLARIRFDAGKDTLWFVGDLVNRGPDSLEVLRFVRGLGERAVAVLGNHDLHLLAVARNPAQLRRSDTLLPVLRAPDAQELLDWLARRKLLHHDGALGFVMTHAGIPSIWPLSVAQERAREVEVVLRSAQSSEFLESMYGDEPAAWSEGLTGMARLRVITNYFTRMRTLSDRCTLDLDFKEDAANPPPGSRPWFDDYRHRARNLQVQIVFGHWAALQGRCDVPGIHALDTGCVWGGALSALRLGPQFVGQERLSVACVEKP
jgi:bis(5'-nucleosyl)-tetraphosphatase (symmetrical)